MTETERTTVPPFSPLVAELSAPIAGADPAGADARYDDDFRALKAHVDALASPTAEADPEEIVRLGRLLLRERSKDLTAVAYLAVGLMRTRGVAGLAEAWAVAGALVEGYWDGLHPRKPVRRRNALQLMGDRTRAYVQGLRESAPGAEEGPALSSAASSVRAVQGRALAELGEGAPSLSGAAAALEERLRRVPAPEPEAEAEPEPEPEPSEPETAEPAPAPEPPPEAQQEPEAPAPTAPKADVPAVTENSDIGAVLTKLNGLLREENPSNPVPYRLLRAHVWDPLRTAPAHEHGVSLLWPPDDMQRRDLERWVELGAHEQVIKLAELLLTADAFPLWLTMQRIEAQAMEAAGEAYAPAVEAVKLEVGLLVRRVPELTELMFKDGTPYADPQTVEWIDADVRPLFGSDAGGGGEPDPLEEEVREARKLLGGGDLHGAIAHLQQAAGGDASAEARFRRRLRMATLCLGSSYTSWARSILEGLDSDVDHHALDEWSPPLALEVWAGLYTCYVRLAQEGGGTPEQLHAQAQRVLTKITRLDPTHALALAGGY